MQRKCVICGIDIDEGVAVCPKCGLQNPTDLPEFQTPPKPTASPKKKSKILPFILGGAAMLIVAVAVLVVTLLGGTPEPVPTPEPTLLDNFLAFENGNVDKLELLAPDEYWETRAQASKLTKDKYLASQKSAVSMQFQMRDKENGSYAMAGEILSEADMNEESLAQIAEMLFTEYGIPESSVTAGKELTIQLTITTSSKSWTTTPEALSAVEIHGSWYLIKFVELEGGTTIAFYK